VLGRPNVDLAANLVEVVYGFSRALAHNEVRSHEITRAIEASGMTTLAHAVSLIKF